MTGGDTTEEIVIRLARQEDAEAIAAIYAPVVRETAISFEVEPPSAEEMARRLDDTMPSHPWLVAERNGEVVGYAYAHRFAERAAYAWSVETSVYLAATARGQRVGHRLYDALIEVAIAQGYRQAIAGIRLPNPASVGLHESFGFRRIGLYERIGWKMGEWHDVGWWQRSLHVGDGPPDRPRRIDELGAGELRQALER